MAFLLFDDSKKKRIHWLLLDRFTTDRAAGAIDGTLSEPSGHIRTVTDSAPNAVITGGQFKVTAVAGGNDPWLRYTTGWARLAGRMLRADVSANNIASEMWLSGFSTVIVAPDNSTTRGVLLANTVLRSQPANVQILSHTQGVTYKTVTILRSTGHFTIIDGKLCWIHRADATATLYAIVTPRLADATCDLRLDNLGIADLPTSDPALYPTPTLSDTFSDTVAPLVSDGLAHVEANGAGAGLTWAGVGAFSNLGNKGYISPTPGPELLTNGDFSAWTGDNPNGWTVAGEVGADPEVTQRASGETHASPPGGLESANLYNSATAGAPIISQNVLIQHSFHRIEAIISAVTGTMRLYDSSLNFDLRPSAVGTYVATARKISADQRINYAPLGAGNQVTLDSVSVKETPFAQCLRAVAPASAAEPYVSAKLTITANTQAGLVINLDSYTNPQNCIHVWLDRVDNKIYARPLIGGVWGADALAGVSVTYSAGAYLEVRRIGTTVTVYYNGAFVGEWTTAVSNANSLVALFATDAASYAESITSYPTGGYDYTEYA